MSQVKQKQWTGVQVSSNQSMPTFSNRPKLPSFSSLDLNNNQANILITLTTQQDEFPTVGLTNMLQNQLTETGAAFGLEVLQITRSGEC